MSPRLMMSAWVLPALFFLGAAAAAAQEPSRPWPEAARFYPAETLARVYSGTAPSLRVDRTALVAELAGALQRYEAGGGTPDSAEGDLVTLWNSLPRNAVPTGKEEELRRRAVEARKAAGKPLSPGEFFLLAIQAAGGRAGEALRAAHACVAPGSGAGAGGAFAAECLAPLRDPEGYQEEALLGVRDSRGNVLLRSARDALGGDESGAWSALLGMAALGLADGGGAGAAAVVRGAVTSHTAEWPAARTRLAEAGDRAAAEAALGEYGTALSAAVRGGRRALPDPDRHCLGLAGLAAGRALRERLRLPAGGDEPAFNLSTPAGDLDYTLLVRAAASLRITGEGGERLEWDGGARRLGGSTALAIVDFLPGAGEPGLVVTPLFRVRRAELSGRREGPVIAGVYRHRTGRPEARPIALSAGKWSDLLAPLSAADPGTPPPAERPTEPGRTEKPAEPAAPPGEFSDETQGLKPDQVSRLASAVGMLKAKQFPVGFMLAGEMEQAEAETRATRFRDGLIRAGKLPEDGGVFLFYRTGNLFRLQWLRTQALEDRLPGDVVTRLWKQAAEEKDAAAVALRFLALLAEALK